MANTIGQIFHTSLKKIGLFRPMKEPTVCNAKPTILSERCQNVLQCMGKINLRP